MAKKTTKIDNDSTEIEKVCIHCGETVKASEKTCPHCGLSVDKSSDIDLVESNNDEPSKKISDKSKSVQSSTYVFIGIGVLVLIAIIAAWWFTIGKDLFNFKKQVSESQAVESEIKNKFNVEINKPEGANDLDYAVEDDDVAKVSYSKVVDTENNITMHFVMRIAKSTEDIERSIGLSDSKGNDIEFPSTPILMTVKCEDGTEVPVESFVALDENGVDMKYMRSTWYDNDNYYSMVTDDLNTREEFLQEVNRVIIANHEKF